MTLKIEILEVNSMFFVFSDILRVAFVAKKVDDFSHIAFENRSLLGPFFLVKIDAKN